MRKPLRGRKAGQGRAPVIDALPPKLTTAHGAPSRNIRLMSKRGARAATLGFVAVLAACTSGTAEHPSVASPGSNRVEGSNGLSVDMPRGWVTDTASAARLRLFAHGRWNGEDCKHTNRKHVAVQADVVSDALPQSTTFESRPAHFTPESGSGVTSGAADQPCGSSSQAIRFLDSGRRLDVYAEFGSNASERDKAAVYKVLDSLRVTPPA